MRTAIYQLNVGGNDVSSAFDPVLISLSVKSDDKNSADELTIELDDSYGQIALPPVGAQIQALLGWDDTGVAEIFVGTVDEAKSGGKDHGHEKHAKKHKGKKDDGGGEGGSSPVHSSGSRSKGRVLTITAKSIDMTSKAKQRTSRHMDNASFSDVATQWGQKAGLTVQVDDALSSVQRPYWSMSNESFIAWGARIAASLDATFKVFGSQAVFVSRSGGQSVSGQDLEDVDVTWGDNLIEWSISPVLSRPGYGAFGTIWYDPQAAKWNLEPPMSGGSGTSSSAVQHTHHFKAPAQTHAQQQSGSNQTETGRESGSGTVTIDGEPAAMPGANANVSGIRDGIDGQYLISEVTHSLSRHSGFTTHLTLKQPSGTAGVDNRS